MGKKKGEKEDEGGEVEGEGKQEVEDRTRRGDGRPERGGWEDRTRAREGQGEGWKDKRLTISEEFHS
jgi:hypothetical protein